MSKTTPGESTNGNGGAGAAGTKNFLLQQLYIKDLSFESPNSPQVFQGGQAEPETELNIRNEHVKLDDSRYEVKLHLNVHAKLGDQTMFVVELDQAGVFVIAGYTPDETRALLGTHCPATLFPYARETISSLVGKGGFPPLVLQPISFDALYARAREQQGASA
jgi:preprotein translocase subunit SecB